MKAGYQKPTIVFEDFELNTAIAAGCTNIINLGPGDGTLANPVCSDYGHHEELRIRPGYSVMATGPDTGPTFYEGKCSCYLSSVGSLLLTS